jgi:hypothetical protein
MDQSPSEMIIHPKSLEKNEKAQNVLLVKDMKHNLLSESNV